MRSLRCTRVLSLILLAFKLTCRVRLAPLTLGRPSSSLESTPQLIPVSLHQSVLHLHDLPHIDFYFSQMYNDGNPSPPPYTFPGGDLSSYSSNGSGNNSPSNPPSVSGGPTHAPSGTVSGPTASPASSDDCSDDDG